MRDCCYPILRSLLFKLPPERAHALALVSLSVAHRLHLLSHRFDAGSGSFKAMGLTFPNRIGLAAGFDKNARYIDALGALGFGFIEVGTVTPRPQTGQQRPRLFRLPGHEALINRMGFPNEGATRVAGRLARRKYRGIVGVNIGKNAATPLVHAIDDYVACYRALAPHADYVAINVSSPNTAELRQLQQIEYLRPILEALLEERHRATDRSGRRMPLLAKIAPDLSDENITAVTRLAVQLGVDGIIATNTTVARPFDGAKSGSSAERGGLSGAPLYPMALRVVETVKAAAADRLAIIGVGGVRGAGDVASMLGAGADLVQVYTGLIYRGPGLVATLRAAACSGS